MNKKVILVIFLSFLVAQNIAAKEELHPKVLFTIENVESGFRANDVGAAGAVLGEEKPGYIAVSYKVVNQDDTRKFDLEKNFKYRLVDEFGNEYRQVKRPDDYDKPGISLSKNFPSLYPNESYGETVFFESPIVKAENVRLIVDAATLGMDAPVELSLKEIVTAPLSDKRPVALTTAETQPSGPFVKIENPADGTVVQPGQTVHLQVRTSSGQVPQKIIVIGFEKTFQDRAPGSEDVYDINIPPAQEPGSYWVNVIAQWSQENEEEKILSDGITLYVKEALPL